MRRLAPVLIVLAGLLVACRAKEKGPDIAALIADLKSDDPDRIGKASLALIRVGEPAVPALAEMLRSEESRHRAAAASTLFGMGAQARAAVPALAEVLRDPDYSIRMTAAMALEGVGPDAAPAVPSLIRALKDREGVVRQRAAKALGAIGPGAKDALSALVEASKFDPVRPAAEEAIRKIQGQ